MKYLLYLSFFDAFHANLDRLFHAIFLQNPKSEVRIHRCTGSLSYCPAVDIPLPKLSFANLVKWLKLVLIQSLFRPLYCNKCLKKSSQYFDGQKRILMAEPGFRHLFKSISLYLNRHKFKRKLLNSISDNTVSCYLVSSRMELSDIRMSFKLARFLCARDYHIKTCNGIMEDFGPDCIGLFNGRMLPYRVMLNVATSSNNDCRVLVHERGFEDSSFVIKVDEPSHSRNSISLLFEKYYLRISSKVSISIASDWAKVFYNGRATGSNVDCQLPTYSYTSLPRESLYSTTNMLIVVYLTTPDEVDPCSDEFILIKNQWKLIPRLCMLLNNSFEKDSIQIVVRTHPNFFLRYSSPLFDLSSKVKRLRDQLSVFDNVRLDLDPSTTSPFLIYKHCSLSVSFASSSLLEGEYFGVPSLVDSRHLYKYGVTYNYDFTGLLSDLPDSSLKLPPSMVDDIVFNRSYTKDKVILFSYIWFYLNSFRFHTLRFSNFSKFSSFPICLESSQDFEYLLHNHLSMDPEFTLNKIVSSIRL
jgi:hypothetical protein